mgnify:CR=1 FL=1
MSLEHATLPWSPAHAPPAALPDGLPSLRFDAHKLQHRLALFRMSGRSARSSSSAPPPSGSSRSTPKSPGINSRSATTPHGRPPGGPGPGLGSLLPVLLLLAGLSVVLVRCSGDSIRQLLRLGNDGPACNAAVNRWANQRLELSRSQLQQEHGLYRSQGENLNAITATMTWIDDRLIDRKISEERYQITRRVLDSSGCRPQFQP